uniref:Uncharacterized protein n=1 Tax=Panagrolaimus davidi TaxID=227884 RepID=A0A914QB32_9BILA
MATVRTAKISADILQITSTIKIPKWPPKSDFPADILDYMKKNSTEKRTLKLMKTNKYFIRKKCPFIYLGDRVRLTQNLVHQIFSQTNIKSYRIEELPNNLGICGTLYIREKNLLSQFISKCVLYDLKCIFFTNHYWINEKFSYDDFNVLTSSGGLEKLGLGNTIVTSNTGRIIPYESLLDHTPALRSLCLEYNNYLKLSQKFIEKICASNLEKFTVYKLPENFETKAFLANMANKKPQLRVHLIS